MSRGFDAIIIGAGQAGPPLADRLIGAGMLVALIERHLFGGTYVNRLQPDQDSRRQRLRRRHLTRRGADYGAMHDQELAQA